MTDSYIQVQIDEIAKELLKRGMTADQIRDYLDSESRRIETEILDGEFPP